MSGRVGVDPIDQVCIFENHDEACDRWRRAGVRDRLLIHIDAHHDAVPRSSDAPVTIANYVRAAIDAGLVREAIWAVPEPSWARPAIRRAIERRLATLGLPMRACPVSALPAASELVLLDIDVDYFVIPEVRFGTPDVVSPSPWCSPADLVDALRARDVRTDLATIAYSVEGGYTPLEWKFLGDLLAALLRSPSSSRAAEPLHDSAAYHYRLAHTHLDGGQLDAARASIRNACQIDPSYRTPYGTAGLSLLKRRDVHGARAAFDRALALDPDNAYALAGCGRIAEQIGQWTDAERDLRRSLALNDRQLDATQALADVLFNQQRWDEAEHVYTRAVMLALAGERSLDAPVSSAPERGAGDPYHGHVHAQLARLAARRGDLTEAIAGARLSLAARPRHTPTRLRLAWLRMRRVLFGAAR